MKLTKQPGINQTNSKRKIVLLAILGLLMCYSYAQYNFKSADVKTRNLEPACGPNSPSADRPEILNSLRGVGIRFTSNQGQIADINGKPRPDILYKGDGGGADIYLRKTGISYVYSNTDEVMHEVSERVEELIKSGILTEADEQKEKDVLLQKESIKVYRVDMDFTGCNSNVIPANEDEVEGYNNFYYSHCPNGITNVKQYNKVTYKNIYNNIDIIYSGMARGLKYDIVVQPHADPNQIKLHWKGAKNIHINREGNLVIKTPVSEFYESIPKVYQNIDGKIIDVKAAYKLTSLPEVAPSIAIVNGSEALVTFKVGSYNPEYPLIIDPWATYYGGSATEYSTGIDTDISGNVFITGYTGSLNIPFAPGAFQAVYGGGLWDAFTVKFNAAGTRIWATLYGGSDGDKAFGITTDIAGNAIISGQTQSVDFPVLSGFQMSFKGGGAFNDDAFVTKFNAAGIRIWATFYGGSNGDRSFGVATDIPGNVVITGETQSVDFPVLSGFLMALGGSVDIFTVKFNTAGTLLWATYYGGASFDSGSDIATDKTGNVVITGRTTSPSTNFPLPVGAFQTAFGGGFNDAFVVKFDPIGNRLWATFYGGSGDDQGQGITIDMADNVLITGWTTSANFPVMSGFQMVIGGIRDAYLVKFDPSGTRLWATFYGTNVDETGNGIATDINNNIYLLMEGEDVATASLVDVCSYQPVFNGGSSTNPNGSPFIEDQLIVKFNPSGKKLCATYMGGTGEDDLEPGGGIVVYGNSIYITGATDGGYPVTTGAFQTTYAGPFVEYYSGGSDAFVASLCTNICEGKVLGLNYTASTTNVCANVPIIFTPTINNSCDTTGYKFHWTFAGGNPASSDSVNPTVAFSGVGTHDVKLVVTTLCKKDSITKANFITTAQCSICNLTGQFTKGTANCNNCGCKEWILITATGGTSPYTYTWPDGYVNRYKNQLCPGAYNINIKDKNGCSINVNLTAP